jgi:drug/metabolite transporter (DMT)-like permease
MFWVGVGILFVAVISEVSQIAFTKSLSSTYSPSVIVMYQFLMGAVYFAPLLLTKGIRSFDAGVYLSWDVIYPTLSLALFCSATAFTSWAYAIKVLGVAKTSVFLAIVPLVTAVLAFLVGEETATGWQWVGLGIAMVGIYFTQRDPVRRQDL